MWKWTKAVVPHVREWAYLYSFTVELFIVRDKRAFEENDSVSPAMIQSIVKKYHCQHFRRRFRKSKDRGLWTGTSGTREMASSRSSCVRYGAVVVEGVSGNRR